MKRSRSASVDERDVGILEYVSPDTAPMGGVIKTRPEDFVVTEIDQKGRVVELDDAGSSSQQRPVEAPADQDSDSSLITRFVLRKERMDTLGAAAVLANDLGIRMRAFGFAGLKDHRAVTMQEMTVRGVAPADVISAVALRERLAVGHVRVVSKPLKLGMLSGNQFRILLRGARGSAADIERALGLLKRRGFVNYYGLQRFGDCAARNDEVGRCLLLGEYGQAVDALLQPSAAAAEGEAVSGGGAEAEARDAWLCSGDARTALRLMPKTRALEREVLAALVRLLPRGGALSHEARCRLALLGIPLAMRRLLAHAYFSKVRSEPLTP